MGSVVILLIKLIPGIFVLAVLDRLALQSHRGDVGQPQAEVYHVWLRIECVASAVVGKRVGNRKTREIEVVDYQDRDIILGKVIDQHAGGGRAHSLTGEDRKVVALGNLTALQ